MIRESVDQQRELVLGRFGMPMTAGGRSFPLLNIQSEKAAGRQDFQTRRCIVPADGFFEWEKLGPKDRQPYYFSPRGGAFALAGVWKEDAKGVSFSILTTAANELVGPIHPRMPVIMGHNAVGQWLAADADRESLVSLLEPYPADLMQGWKVSKSVNSPKNKDAGCINSL